MSDDNPWEDIAEEMEASKKTAKDAKEAEEELKKEAEEVEESKEEKEEKFKEGLERDVEKSLGKKIGHGAKKLGKKALEKGWDHTKSAAKATGSGSMAAAGALGGAAIGSAAWAGRKAKGAPSAIRGSNFKIFFWVSLIIHTVYYFDALLVSGVKPLANYMSAAGIYVILAIWAWRLFSYHGFLDSMKSLLTFFMISAFCVFAPVAQMLFPDASTIMLGLSITEIYYILLFIIPVWPVYVGSKFDYGGMRLLRFIWSGLIILTLIYLIFTSNVWSSIPAVQANSAPMVKFVDKLLEGGKKFGETIWGIPADLIGEVQNFTNPQYTAQVEQNRGNQLGVYITSIETIPRTVYPEQPVSLKATIQAKSFTDKVPVHNNCFIQPPNKDQVFGTFTDSSGTPLNLLIMDITQQDTRTIVCTFDDDKIKSLADDRTGSYIATMNSTFVFETWGYMTYSFIDTNRQNELLEGKKNIHALYGLDERPYPIYTDGPVSLGLEDPSNPTPLPWSIDPEGDSVFLYFGITIKNKDPNGKVIRINKDDLVFKIPEPLKLIHSACVPSGVVEFVASKEERTNVYTLNKEVTFGRDAKSITITCPVELEGGNKIGSEELLGNIGVAMATFAVQAKYEYELLRTAPFTIRDVIQ